MVLKISKRKKGNRLNFVCYILLSKTIIPKFTAVFIGMIVV